MGEIDAAAVHDLVKTGDLVLFGDQGLVPGLVRWFLGGRWSHIGMVLRGPDAEPLLWEAVPRHRSPSTGGARRPRAVRLLRRVVDFPGEVSLRLLDRELHEAQRERLDALRRELSDRRPEPSLLDLMGAGDDGWIGSSRDNLGAPLAAELIAQAYQRIGLLDDPRRGGRPAGDYAPRDFAVGGRVELKGGFALGPEIPLRRGERTTGWTGLTPQTA